MTIQEKAKQYLSENPNVKKIFATADGFLFLEKKDAQNHAETLEDKQVLTFEAESEIEKEDNDSEDTYELLKVGVNKIAKRVKTINDIPLLEAFILQEESEANREKVLKLLAERIEELKTEK